MPSQEQEWKGRLAMTAMQQESFENNQCKKQALKQNTAKHKLSRTRMQRQALKNYNAKGKFQELSMQESQTL